VNVDPDGHCCLEEIKDAIEVIAQNPQVVDKALKGIATATAAAEAAPVLLNPVTLGVVGVGLLAYDIHEVAYPSHTAGQSNDEERAQIQQASQERAAQNGGVDPQLGQARGAGEEQSQSDDAKDKARTNGGFAKPNKGPGSVPKDQRDSKRSLTRAERQKLLDQQKGICPWCGKPATVDKTATHHVKRHADGGKTKKPNLKAVCQKPCHHEIHK
jgi:hypothetical protein